MDRFQDISGRGPAGVRSFDDRSFRAAPEIIRCLASGVIAGPPGRGGAADAKPAPSGKPAFWLRNRRAHRGGRGPQLGWVFAGASRESVPSDPRTPFANLRCAERQFFVLQPHGKYLLGGPDWN